MISVKESATKIQLCGDAKQLNELAKAFRYRPDDYFRAPSYQIYKATDGADGWDGYLYPLKTKGNTGWMLRGLLEDLQEEAKKLAIKLDTSNLLFQPFENLLPDDLPDDLVQGPFQPDENQRTCIVECLKRGIGISRVTVGGGKTLLMAATAAMIKRRFPEARFLYFTQSERLVRQVFSECSTKFLPDWDITQFGGGSRDYSGKDMVVATGASLHRNFKKLVSEGWFKTFMGVLVDEVHHCASDSWSQALLVCPAFFRIGASDTMKEGNQKAHLQIKGLVGPIRHTVGAEGLIQIGRLAKPHIYLVDCQDWKGKFADLKHAAVEDTPAWTLLDGEWKKAVYAGPVFEQAIPDEYGNLREEESDGFKRDRKGNKVAIPSLHRMLVDKLEMEIPSRWCLLDRLYDKAIIQFKERNNLITQWAKYYSDKGYQTLIVATRTLHVLILEALCQKAIKPELVRILFSEHSSKQRDETFDWLRKTPGAVLITPLCKEGVSIPEIRAGIVADPVADWEFMNQIIGRFIRKKIDGVENEAHITLFIDRQHANYRRNSIKLFQRLEQIRGYTYYWPVKFPTDIKTSLRYSASEL